jgi:non-canonical (house-cleaning) NTP pyrophosphatase
MPEPLRIAVGTTRAPKLEALRRALARIRSRAPELAAAELLPRDVGDVAPRMPLSLDELLDGARARAERALELARGEGLLPALAVGLEGGLDVRQRNGRRQAFLMSWAYATDGTIGAHGSGGAIELPADLIEPVVDQGLELSEAIDRFARETDVRSRQGAWGVLTDGLVERAASFETALLAALAPFYNTRSYRSRSTRGASARGGGRGDTAAPPRPLT